MLKQSEGGQKGSECKKARTRRVERIKHVGMDQKRPIHGDLHSFFDGIIQDKMIAPCILDHTGCYALSSSGTK